MALKFIQDIRNQIDSTIPDNTTGLVTPAVIRANLQDMTDSLFTRGCALLADHQGSPVGQSLTTTPTVYASLYTTNVNLNQTIFTINQPSGTIDFLQAGFYYEIAISGNVSGPNNNTVYLEVYKNSVSESRTRVAVGTTGTSDYLAFSEVTGFTGIAANDTFELRLSSGSSGTFNFAALVFQASLYPTQTAV